jgi:hypothetical protein
MLMKKDAGYVSKKSPRYRAKREPKEFTLFPMCVGENISIVSCGNAMGTAAPYFMFSLFLYLNLHAS